MDLFPNLGEPGMVDELFYFGPLAIQVIFGAWFFWLTGRWMKSAGWRLRAISAFGMVLAADLFLFSAFGVVFTLANPTL